MPNSPTYPSRPAAEIDPTGEFERAQRETQQTGSGGDFAIIGDGAFLTIANRLRNWVTDWNGEPMVRGEPPRDGLHCDDLYDAADALDALKAENERLRGALRIVADQITSDEVPPQALDAHKRSADWHAGYDAAIEIARAALGEKP